MKILYDRLKDKEALEKIKDTHPSICQKIKTTLEKNT